MSDKKFNPDKKVLEDAIEVPRYAVRGDNEVWVVNDNHLKVTKVQIARNDKKSSYITSGLKEGDIIVTSPIDAVTDGMKLRVHISESDEAGEVLER